MNAVLVVGNAVLDIINTVSHYPKEDEELRATHQVIRAGGNALNTACSLEQQGNKVAWLGTLAQDQNASFLREQLISYERLDLSYAYEIMGVTPCSYITLNQSKASRTIVHYRDLPELPASLLYAVPVEQFDWLHFEGRNIAELTTMLKHARDQVTDQPISLEVEKPRMGIENLIQYADLVMFSHHYAQAKGYGDAPSFLDAHHAKFPKKLMSCTWGAQGAWLLDQQGEILHQKPSQRLGVVNTVGAGDAFNAGLIHGFCDGLPASLALKEAVKQAERVII